MTYQEKVIELKERIVNSLTPLVGRDYRYLMMCDHENIGDTLIMEGEFAFLSGLKSVRCKEYTTMVSFEQRHPAIPEEDLLIIRGSGSFGDVWPEVLHFFEFVLRNYPNNPILFMPQTIHFIEQDNLDEMKALISGCKNVTLCVRDSDSYSFAQKQFECASYLVPDMAFAMKKSVYTKADASNHSDKVLLVKREDKESRIQMVDGLDVSQYVVSDWPTFSIHSEFEKNKRRLVNRGYYRLYDFYIRFVYRHFIVQTGVRFLSDFDQVYATRMHAGILAMMMGKRVVFMDNSYGKLSRVYNTWLKGVDNVSLVD